MQERPYLSVKERLDIVEEEVVSTFHQKLNGQQGASMFDTPQQQGFGEVAKKAKGYSDLPKTAQERCDELIKTRRVEGNGYKGLKGQDALKLVRSEYANSHFSFNQ